MSAFPSPEFRLGTYYAVVFGAVGLVMPFLALWLDARGVSAAMIGAVVATPSIAMILTTVPIGRRIDALGEPRTGIVALNVLILAANVALAFAHGEWAILVVWTLGGVLVHAVMPAGDALALDVTRRRGSDWARLRMFGSMGFVVALLGAGALYERFGIGLFLGVLIATSALRLLAAAWLPGTTRGREAVVAAPRTAPAARPGTGTDDTDTDTRAERLEPRPEVGSLHHPGVLLTLAGAAAINASHAFFYVFGLLAWTRAGIGETAGSALWGVGAVAEIALMWRFGAIARRLSARLCLIVAGGLGALRWGVTALEPAFGWLLLAQTLHAATFGLTFLAGASFIARRVAPGDAVRGQSLLATFAAGAMAATTWGAGWLYERGGASVAYAAMAVLCVIGASLVAASYRTALDRRTGGG